LGPSLGQCCGGVVNLLMEITPLSRLELVNRELQNSIYPSDFQITVFGAGHVGQALVNVLGALPCAVTWIDSRSDIFPNHLSANVKICCVEDPEFEVQNLAPHSYCVVMTHSHQLDEKIVAALLKRDDIDCCGLIGSKSKALRFKKRLTARGLTTEQLSRLVCPVGDPAIKGKHPGEIALSMASQLLQLHQNNKLANVSPARTARA
jgi:xanthine dehydrogenase accessory factor